MSEEPQNELARKIAVDVMVRRRSGEPISDIEILAEYPIELEPFLKEQLQRVQMLESARKVSDETDELVDSAEISTAQVDAPDAPVADIRITTVAEDAETDDPRRTEIVTDAESIGNEIDINKPARRFRPENRPPIATLKVFSDGSTIFTPAMVHTERFSIGRRDCDLLIPYDPNVSALHAEIERVQQDDGRWLWTLRDLDSTNGTFVCVDHVALKPGDEILIGQERYRFLTQDGRVGLGLVHESQKETLYFDSHVVWLGRAVEGAMQSMRNDPCVDPNHAILRARGKQWLLINNDSVNGIWFRVKQVSLTSSCLFQVGEQRIGFQR